jgi:phage tail sheath protein FI
MPATYKTPGVYVEEISKFPPSIAAVETAIPAFIGFTEKATLKEDGDLNMVPKRITSLLDYETYYGTAQVETAIEVTVEEVQETQDGSPARISLDARATLPAGDRSRHIMYYAMQMFFANGGGPCYIVSVGTFGTLGDPIDQDLLADGLEVLANEDEPTLIVFPEGQGIDSAANYHGLQTDALDQCATLQDRFAVMDIWRSGDPATDDIQEFRNGIGTNNLKYGAAYYPNLRTTLTYAYEDEDVTLNHDVILDGQAPTDGTFNEATLNTVLGTNNENSDFYSAVKQAIRKLTIELPPSSSVVGVYATVDNARGVWKAPANVSLDRVLEPTVKINDMRQADLNVHSTGKSINAIRAFTGRGIMVWGARTLAGNDNEWRYIPVRRFFNMVEESAKKATGQFVFEPNDANTWVKVRGMIENFLLLQWRAGALAGAKPEHAFFVKVGLGETMTAQDILEGRMIVEIGMAVVRPAEFIILRFMHKMQES